MEQDRQDNGTAVRKLTRNLHIFLDHYRLRKPSDQVDSTQTFPTTRKTQPHPRKAIENETSSG